MVRHVQDRTAPLIYVVLINREHTDGLQCPLCLSATPCNRTFYSMHVHDIPNHNTRTLLSKTFLPWDVGVALALLLTLNLSGAPSTCAPPVAAPAL
jgi:hypothetical protein